MSTPGNYYLNGPTLETATSVFDDPALTICAADGFYSNGVIVRQQINCLLTAIQTCPSCVLPCTTTIAASGGTGIYQVSFDTIQDLGAVIIYFDPANIPDGIRATLGSATENKLTSEVDGYHGSSTVGNYTFVGNTAQDCGLAAQLNASPITNLDVFIYTQAGFPINPDSQTGVVTGTGTDVSLSAGAPDWCTLVIPKIDNSFTTVLVEIVGLCGSTGWDLEVNCPRALTGTPITTVGTSDCTETVFPDTVYVAPNRNGTDGCPEINEFAFADSNGVNKYPAGIYTINPTCGKSRITIDANGVISAIVACP
jgi:hypothetical protein